MEYKVDGWNNFCRVFELPEQFPNGFCGRNGIPVTFKMVDWFNPIPGLDSPAVSKEVWKKEVGDIEEVITTSDEVEKSLFQFLKGKQYVIAGRKYIVICNFGATFQFIG